MSRRLLALAAWLLASTCLAAVTGRGTEFWACWPRSHLSLETSAEVIVMSDAPVQAQIDGAFTAGPAPVAPGAPWIVALPQTLRLAAERTALPVGFRIRSLDPARPIQVTLRVPRQAEASDDTARLLPVAELGLRYRVTGYAASLPGEPSLYAVVATEDGTTVDAAIPCLGLLDRVVLDRGETYQVFCDWRDPLPDVTGSEVVADKPVAVFAGASNAYVPANWLSGDFILEQMTPVASWGTEFYVAPLPKGPGAVPTAHDVVRVTASAAGTLQVDEGAGPAAFALAGPGAVVTLQPRAALRLTADVPVDVHQFATGVEMTDLGDPFMAHVPALSQWGTGARAWIPAYYSLGNYLTILAPDTALGSVRVDGAAVAGWQSLPGGTHSWVQLDAGVLPGERVVSADEPVSVLVHGYNAAYLPDPGLGRTPGSHGTPAAHAATPCAVVPLIDVPPSSCAGATLELREAGSTSSGCDVLEYRWLQDGVEIPGCGFSPAADCDVTFRSEAVYSLEARCVADPSCSGTASQRVIDQPPPAVRITPDPVTVCAGERVTLTVPDGFFLYSWTSVPPDPGSTPRTSALPTIEVSPETDTTYTVAAFDSRGCATVDGLAVTVVPDPLPPALGASLRASKSGRDVVLSWQDLPEIWGSYEVVALECVERHWRVTCPAQPPDPVNIQAAPLAGPGVPPGTERLSHAGAVDRPGLIFYKVRATSVCANLPGPTCNPWPMQIPPCP